jgi:hypothetical protein
VIRYGHTITYKVLDRGMIEEIGPTGIARMVRKWAGVGSRVQSGQINHYSITIVIGTVVMIMINSQ